MILDSLLSVFLVIALGWALRRWVLPDERSWHALETISFYLLVPVLIGKTLISAKIGEVPFAALGATLLGTILTMAALLVAGRPLIERLLGIGPASFTSIFQGTLRWNSFIALAIAANLFGASGVTLAAVAFAVLIPVLNVMTILVLGRYGEGNGGSLLRGVVTNPFILSTAGGLLLNLSGASVPRAIGMMMDIIGQCALGAGLILVGVGLRLGDLQKPNRALVAGTAMRLLGAPLLGVAIGGLVGLSGSALVVAIVCLGVPTAGAAYILARKMGGDAPLMAAITTAQTFASMITLPLIVSFYA